MASGEIALFFESEAPILEAQEHDGGVALSLNPPKSHLSHEKNHLTFHYTVCLMLLMVQKSHSQPPGMYKTPVNNGINYQPQLVQDLSHQQ